MSSNFFRNATLYPIYFYILENFLIVLTISFTSSSSVFRPALLPLLVIAAHPVILSCHTALYRNTWAGLVGGNIITTIFHYVEISLLSKWDFDAKGPTCFPAAGETPFSVRKSRVQGPVSRLSGCQVLERLKFGYAVTTSHRNIGTRFVVKNTPAFSTKHPNYIPSRTRFCLWRMCTIASTILIIDLVSQESTTLEENAVRYSGDTVHILTGKRENLAAAQIMTRLVTVLGYWFCTAIVIDAFSNIFSVLSVLLHIKDVKDYRPNFGPVGEAYTVRRFWG